MSNTWKIALAGLVVLLLVFMIGLPLLGWLFGSGAEMGPWMMGPSEALGIWGTFGMLGGFMLLGMMIIPVLLIVGAVALVVTLVRGNTNQGPANPAGVHPCPHCGKYVQNDWNACPYVYRN